MITLKYISAGLFSYISYILLLATAINFFPSVPTVCAAFCYMFAICLNFTINRTLVFDKSEQPVHLQGGKYAVVGFLGWSINTAGFWLFVEKFSINLYISQLILFVLVGLFTYLVNRNWSFK